MYKIYQTAQKSSMIIDYFKAKISSLLRSLSSSIKFYSLATLKIATLATAIVAIIALLERLGIWTTLKNWFTSILQVVIKFVFATPWGAPNLIWVLLFIFLIGIGYLLVHQLSRLGLVAGEFSDNFAKGLHQWDYDREGWKIEFEDNKPILSVEESQDGGITKKGFDWNDYEFSFETKVIKKASGWIVRAENRSKYFMLQLSLDSSPLLRPHFRIPHPDYPWIFVENDSVDLEKLNLKKPICLMEWIKVKIIVNGGELDFYLNEEHVFHYALQDPYALPLEKKVEVTKKKEKEGNGKEELEVTKFKEAIIWSYNSGRVGFRCAPGEHSHYRNVRVKPLLSIPK